MDSVGASSSWSWHGYAHSAVNVGGRPVPVVSGGAHWGGGLWISALDLARIGHLCLRGGRHGQAAPAGTAAPTCCGSTRRGTW
jgi:CubicO group peptidase (beta-lactamase class C family)